MAFCSPGSLPTVLVFSISKIQYIEPFHYELQGAAFQVMLTTKYCPVYYVNNIIWLYVTDLKGIKNLQKGFVEKKEKI